MNTNLPRPKSRFPLSYLLPLLLLGTLFWPSISAALFPQKVEMTYTEFKAALRAGEIRTATVGVEQISGQLGTDKAYHTVRVDDIELLKELEANKVNATGEVAGNGGIFALLGWLLPMAVFGAIAYFMLKSMRGAAGGAGGAGGIFSFGKSKARVIKGEQTGVTFQNVGGAGEAVEELREITEYLKDPERFQRLGGRMTKGVILVGSPGTGKTLLAKATAGEAEAPFFSVSASEFVEMFVGVGASACATFSNRPRRRGPALSSLMSLTPSAGGAPGPAQWARTRNASRPSTNSWPRWMVSSRSMASS